MPKGFLDTHFKPGVTVVSNKLGGSKNSRIENTSTILLRKILGMDIFNAMLTSLGTKADRASPSPLDSVDAVDSWESDRRHKHYLENRNQYSYHEKLVDTRLAITYPKLFMDMLKEALRLFFSGHSYISVMKAYFLFNSTLEKTIESGILDTANLDLKYTSDKKPKGSKMEFQKVFQEMCNEKKLTLFLKEDNRTFEKKGVENSNCNILQHSGRNELQDFILIDIADKVVTKHVAAHGTNSLGDVQNNMGIRCVNSNDKKEWTFTQPDLKGEKGWTMQLRSNKKKQFFSPEGIRCESIPQVKKHISAVKDGTAIATKQKRKCRSKNNNERVAHKFTEEGFEHLDGWKRQARNKGYQYITPKGKIVGSLNEVRKHDEYKPKSTKRSESEEE
jgi:hypothetical protein